MYLSLIFSVLWLSALGPVIRVNGQGQKIDIKVLQASDDIDGQCSSTEKRERARNEIHQIATSVDLSIILLCGSPGWRRVAFFNMTDTNYNCPTGLNLTSYSKRTCGRSPATCTSTIFSTGGLSYSRVCGRIRGYQYGSTSAFRYSIHDIDGHYADGVSLTHGGTGRRQHIWTFAAGLSENTTVFPGECCPCDTPNHARIPTFIGNDYFCESGLHSAWNNQYYTVFHSNDVLWDGQGCTSNSTCCQFNNPPWFTKSLPTATTDDIELRICADQVHGQEDVAIELIELYVQ